ncbi:MAG: GDP-L-fucose synthase [Gemmatimonadaceae bacterium]|nr:GDP-L-fucose synthase [Gemmatimonadaceae bacterium]
MDKSAKVFVAGHRGLVGSALVRELEHRGYDKIVTRTRSEVDLRDQRAVQSFFAEENPDVVLLAAAKVGGIHANNVSRWEFLHENLQIQNNVLGASLDNRAEKVVFFGSSCIYPKLSDQPIKEDYLLTGALEPTNEPYAIAKIAGLKLVESANIQYGQSWLSLMPTNLYGPGDNFDLVTSHVLPAMIRKFHEAKLRRESGDNAPVVLWGSGKALREFLHVDDLARAALHLMETGATGLYNVGYGSDLPIRQLAATIAAIVDYDGPIEWDTTRTDGTPRKFLDSSKIRATGWAPAITLDDGIRSTYDWYLKHSAIESLIAARH